MAQNPVAIVASVKDVVVLPTPVTSFALNEAMANSLFEMLGALTGQAIPKTGNSNELTWHTELFGMLEAAAARVPA